MDTSTTPFKSSDGGNQSDIHDIQMRYKLSPATMKVISSIPLTPDRQHILHKACLASEFRSFSMKASERDFFREVNDHTAIPYTIKETVTQPWHKVFLLVQVDLLQTGWPNKISASARAELYKERTQISVLLDRVLRCIVDVIGLRRDGRGVNVALDVLRSVNSGSWEGGGKELLLIDHIGPAKMDKLFKAGIKSIHQLRKLEFYHIERILSRNPPFGHQVLNQLAGFPRLLCQFEVIHKQSSLETPLHNQNAAPDVSFWVCRVVLGYENDQLPLWKKINPWVTLVIEGADGRLLWFWRGSVKKLTEQQCLVLGLATKSEEKVGIQFACEELVGTMVHITHQMP
ncbi:hypothetical protein QQS21_000989 [Conoideocrella luteorostrata]|uniref:SEC63 domain-containing protein n=1 Tax=Conoideocrella luteorostrata TaxID=1105319 RepID=A0AAJ0CY40_9HYPO|nr:hypothetical protein QQS21_000989 [Conoideocrella luteorostrata]